MRNENEQRIIEDMQVRTVSREELCRRLNRSDRLARKFISELALDYPVISFSDGSGYLIATSKADIQDAVHAANENAKRAREILKRNNQLNEFIASNLGV